MICYVTFKYPDGSSIEKRVPADDRVEAIALALDDLVEDGMPESRVPSMKLVGVRIVENPEAEERLRESRARVRERRFM